MSLKEKDKDNAILNDETRINQKPRTGFCDSMTEHVPSIHKGLCSIPAVPEKK
jgi:hypothetical protein